MFIDGTTIREGEGIDTDICIIGAGAAGITLALALEGSGRSISMIESGDTTMPTLPDRSYEFVSVGMPVSQSSRVRAFGGTTSIWAGKWKRRDAIDFEKRPWMDYSSWPLSLSDLMPYYDRASHVLGFHADLPSVTSILSASDTLKTIMFEQQKKPQRNWGKHFMQQFEASKTVSVYTNSHALMLEGSSTRVAGLRVRSSSGKTFNVKAHTFILALGGIENARMLLLSQMGNVHDQVGRYYMDHPKGKAGIVELYRPLVTLTSLDRCSDFFAGYRLNDAVEEKYGILNSHITLEPLAEKGRVASVLRQVGYHVPFQAVSVLNYMEQAPNPDSRVTLDESLDAFGYPKARVDWRMSEIDKKTMRIFHQCLRDELQKLGIGELRSPVLDAGETWPIGYGASHPMGTTRMGNDPRTSVVDADARVHGMDNLFVAGSSVFTTSGYANPTATIAALAVRLADHLTAA